MMSVICVYNDDKTLNDYLLQSVNVQDTNNELILIDNTENVYLSAAAALNAGAKRASGDYLIFAHQDIKLDSLHWLRHAEAILSGLPHLGVAGVAGKTSRDDIISNIKHGSPPRFAGNVQTKESTEVETLDECLIIIPRKVYDLVQFDELSCDDWHLYAVDYCLNVRKDGYRVFVLPLSCYHRSSGSFSGGYFSTLEKLRHKHRPDYNIIYTTMGNWYTAIPVGVQKNRIWRALNFILAGKIASFARKTIGG